MSAAPGTAFQRQKGFDMLVLGGGVAGLTAAWHGARLGLGVALLEPAPLFGGQVATLGAIDDFPAVGAQSGPGFAAQLLTSAREAGAAVSEDAAVRIRRTTSRIEVETRAHTLLAKNVLIATGARPRPLPVAGAERYAGRGLSHCATCDGPLFRGRAAVVVGGGDAALQAALELAQFCQRVTVVTRHRLRARQAYIDAAARRPNLEFAWDTVVEAILGDAGVSGVRLRHLPSGAVRELPCFGVFPLIGGLPNSEPAAEVAELAADGAIRTTLDFETATPGVFAIGAVRAGFGGALASAAGEGAAVAAALARRFRK